MLKFFRRNQLKNRQLKRADFGHSSIAHKTVSLLDRNRQSLPTACLSNLKTDRQKRKCGAVFRTASRDRKDTLRTSRFLCLFSTNSYIASRGKIYTLRVIFARLLGCTLIPLCRTAEQKNSPTGAGEQKREYEIAAAA